MAVIYRIRNRITGKCYIGETMEKDPYERWKGHLNAIQRGKGCPALRDAVQKHGLEAFEFQILIFCFDEDRFKYEIEYIAKYNTQVPNGYNIAEGGQGGPLFAGKKHTPETIAKIQKNKQKYYDDPEYCKKLGESVRNAWANPEMKQKLRDSVKNSEKFRKAVEEGRVGGGIINFTDEIRQKISNSVKKYYETNTHNIDNQRKAMAKAVGKKVYQYTKEGVFVKSYDSIREAGRGIGDEKYYKSIMVALDKSNRSGKGFVWKTTGPSSE